MGDKLRRGWADEQAKPYTVNPAFEAWLKEYERIQQLPITEQEEDRLP